MNSTPYFSIITISYNSANTIEKTIKSVLAQERGLYEFIIIDGKSDDGTQKIIEKYKKNINFYVSEPDGGISDAFNKGAIQAKGKYIIFLSSDDYFFSDEVLHIVYKKSMNHEFDMLHGDTIHVKDGLKTKYYAPKKINKIQKDMIINHQALFMKKKLFKNIGGFDNEFKLAMDYEIVLKSFYLNSSFLNLNQVVSYVSAEGVSHLNYIESRKEVLKIQLNLNKNHVTPYLYFYFALARYLISNMLQRFGLTIIVRLYKSHISNNKKEIYKNS